MNEFAICEARIIDRLNRDGCPICSAADEAVRSFMEALLYESVNDPEFRRTFEMSGGFCSVHTRVLADFGDPFDIAILFSSLLSSSSAHELPERNRCSVCKIREEASLRAMHTLRKLAEAEKLFSQLNVRLIFCRKHFRQLLEILPREFCNDLRKLQEARLGTILKLLAGILNKMDYRSRGEALSDEEKFALRAVLGYFSTFEELS
ncbi:MAG: DUF6062 family protein [Bacteroidota bacterium]